MHYVLALSLFLMMLIPAPALAQQPTPENPGGYHFEAYDYENGNTVDLSEELNIFNTAEFIQPAGNTAVTMWQMVNAANVIGVLVVLLLALKVLWWVYGKVTDSTPPTAKLSDVTDNIDYIRNNNPFRIYETKDGSILSYKKKGK